MRLERRRARYRHDSPPHPLIAISAYPRDHSCPATTTKTTIPAAGVTGPRGGKGRSGAARGAGEEVRQARVAGKAATRRRRAAPLCREIRRREIVWQEALCGRGQALRRQARSRRVRRAAIGDAPRPRFDRPMMIVRRGDRRERDRASRATIVRAAARSARSSRAATGRNSIAATVRRAATATSAPGRRSPIGSSATGSPIRRAKVAAKSGLTRRAAKVFARTATVRAATGPMRAAVARWRSSPWRSAARKFGGDKKFSRGAPDRGPRKDFGERGRRARRFKAVAEARGSSASAIRGPPAMARAISTSRVLIEPRDDRGGEERPRFSRSREDRPAAIARNSIVPRAGPAREGRTDWQEHPRSEAA